MTVKKKICKVCIFLTLAVFILSSFFSYLFYLDLKKSFLARITGIMSLKAGLEVEIREFSFNVKTGVDFSGIAIRDPEGFPAGQLLEIDRVSFSPDYTDLLRGKLHIKKLTIFRPLLTFRRNAEGKLNISEELRRLFSEKGEGEYEIDEFRILSGLIVFPGDLVRVEKLDLHLQNLSSKPGIKTLIKGGAFFGAGSIAIEGWAKLSDEQKPFEISISAEDLGFAAFKGELVKDGIDPDKLRMKISIKTEGNIDQGIHLSMKAKLSGGNNFIPKINIREITGDAVLFYDIPGLTLRIKTIKLELGGIPVLMLNGKIRGLKKPAYDLNATIRDFDLSTFNLLKGIRVGGLLSSDSLKLNGRLGKGMPDLDGSLRFRDVSVKSDTGFYLRKINGRVSFARGRKQALKADAEVLKAAGYSFAKPALLDFSLSSRKRPRDYSLSATLNSSAFRLIIGENRSVFFDNLRIMADGALRGSSIEGKGRIDSAGMAYNEISLRRIKSGFGFKALKENFDISNVRIMAENLRSTADLLSISKDRRRNDLLIKMVDLNAEFPSRNAAVNDLDISARLRSVDGNLFGGLSFSAKGVKYRGIESEKISGKAGFDEKEISVDVPFAVVAGGTIGLSAAGSSDRLFPIRAEISAEKIDIGKITGGKDLSPGFGISGALNAIFRGSIDSKESVNGEMNLDLNSVSLINRKTKRYLLKNVGLQPVINFRGKDFDLKTGIAAGRTNIKISAVMRDFLKDERDLQIEGELNETLLTELRDSFWDIFPDSLLYAGMEGSVSAGFRAGYKKQYFNLNSDIKFRDVLLEGENGEYSIGRINGVFPLAYGYAGNGRDNIVLPSFERSDFINTSRYYKSFREEGYRRMTIGSLRYGFRLLTDMTLLMKREKALLNVGKFSANIFGGKLNGSAVLDFSEGPQYRGGMIIEGLSLARLSDDITPIKGYISGKLDGIGTVKGAGGDLSQLIGRADFWTYATREEKTKISREFLRKIGGPSIKPYVGDRKFDKGIMSLYIQKGFFIFRELEISNRNIFGVKDLNVKVAPFSNRIGIKHLMSTIAETAERAKKTDNNAGR